MARLGSFLGIIAALALAALAAISWGGTATVRAPETAPPSALATLPAAPSPSPALPNVPPSAPRRAAPEPSVPVSAPQAPPAASVLPSDGGDLDAAASALRAALVNILCYASAGGPLHSISGSGVIIDSKGIILTNAHVAQYFLLADRGVSCTIRTGSPAADAYDAALAYFPAAWADANASVLTEAAPAGTGEHDYALLAVTKSATGAPLPAVFPSVPLAAAPLEAGAPVVIASYGAQFLETNQIQSALFPTLVFGSVKDVYTFGTNTIDVLALGGSAAAQEGSSGGGVADARGALAGTITTSTVSGSTATRSLDAITASYIRADYASQTGSALDLLLGESTTTAVAAFAPSIPALEAVLTAALPSS